MALVSYTVTATLGSVDTSHQFDPNVTPSYYYVSTGSAAAAPGYQTSFVGFEGGTPTRFYHDDLQGTSPAGYPQSVDVGVLVSDRDALDTQYVVSITYQEAIGAYNPNGATTLGGVAVVYRYKGPLYTPPPPPPPPPANTPITPVASYALAEDAHGRPVALSPNKASPANTTGSPSGQEATGINGLVSNTAGKTYLISGLSDTFSGYFADNSGADNPCLLVDRRTNHFRAIYSLSQSYIYGGASQQRMPDQIVCALGLITDRFAPQITTIPNITGGLCAAAQHPTDADYALLVYSDIGTTAAPGSHDLKAAFSADAGATWKPLPTVLPGLDLTVTGRPALCWLGSTAILVYSAGAMLSALTSPDRGQTWTPAAALSPGAPSGQDVHYFCVSLAAHEGQVYLLAFTGNTQQVMPGTHIPQQSAPALFVSGNGGRTWVQRGVLPGISAPSGIGVSPASGVLRLDTRYVSHDSGQSWVSP